jgi:hypothetical protein
MVYGKIALAEGLRAAQIKALKRAFTLYKLTVALTLIFAGVSIVANFGWASDLSLTSLPSFLLQVATLHETMFLTDIPMIYTFLMLVAPIGLMLLIKGRTRLLVASSGGLWLASQIFPNQIQLPWRVVNSGTFDLAAWQALFFIAMVIGYHRDALAKKLSQIPRLPYFVLSGLLLLALVQFYLTHGAILAKINPGLDLPSFLSNFFQKVTLAPGRLIASFIVFQFAYLVVTILWKPIQKLCGWLLLPLGQNALYSYTMHVAVIAILAYVIPKLPSDVMSLDYVNTAVQLSGVFAIWFMIQRKFLFKIVPR